MRVRFRTSQRCSIDSDSFPVVNCRGISRVSSACRDSPLSRLHPPLHAVFPLDAQVLVPELEKYAGPRVAQVAAAVAEGNCVQRVPMRARRKRANARGKGNAAIPAKAMQPARAVRACCERAVEQLTCPVA